MICHRDEPEYFLSQALPHPLPSSSFAQSLPPLLRHLRAVAAGWLGDAPAHAVVAVPQDWYVDDAAHAAIKLAAASVGLDVVRVLRAHAAAAVGHGLETEPLDEEKVLVYELGREDFETTVIDVEYGVFDPLRSSRSAALGKEIAFRIQKGDSSEALERLFEKTTTHVEKILKEANLTTSDVVAVVLTGEHAAHTLALDVLDTLLDPDATRDVPFYVLPFSHDAVSVGAAYQARLLSGETCEDEVYHLPAITDRALAVGALAGAATQMVRRYSAIPLEVSYNFTTALDDQAVASIPVLLGGFASAGKNTRLGTLRLENIPRARAGEPTIAVRMKLDEDSSGDVILTARAALLHADGTESSVSDELSLGDWFRFEDPELEDVIAAERADDLVDHKVCANPLASGGGAHFPADAVVRRDHADMARFWPTRAAAREVEDGNLARALCLYEKSLPYFPLGHAALAREIRALWGAFRPERDDSPVLGADNPFLTPSRTGC